MRHLVPVSLIVAVMACGGRDSVGPPDLSLQPVALRPPTSPENLLYNIQVLYNDTLRTKDARLAAYEDLLAPGFIFHFQPVDWDSCGCQDWGRTEEIGAHAGIFGEQAMGHIFRLQLDMAYEPPRDLDPPDPNKPGWKEIFVTNVFLKLLRDPNNGFVIHGGQAEFEFSPSGDRWYIADWKDLPRPATVEPSSWGKIKAIYRR